MNSVPCPLCGYDAPGTSCPHCELRSTDPTLAGPAPDTFQGLIDGFRAVPTGLYLLLTTRGVKRLLLPPVILTGAIFGWLFYMMISFLLNLVDAAELQDPALLDIETGWLRSAAEWLIAQGIVITTAKIGSWLVVLVGSFFLMWWIGSIVYEAIAGPFLDEVHGRLEKKWFGRNPRDEIERPVDIPASRCALLSVVAGVPAFACLVVWWVTSGIVALFFLALVPVPFAVLGVLIRDYGTWLAWVAKVEGRTLLVSVKASFLSLLVLIPAFVIKLIVPVFGPFLFVLIAGFATSLTLLDIPFSRRQWSLPTRFQFLVQNLPAMISFGAVSALLFAVPLFGPILMVPSASVGGVWLICRLDKNALRDASVRMERGA